jgi:3-oxoacyl-[acyl-carrier protein] reductase
MKLKDKVAIVTGAGTGIGRAIALAYVQEGAAVVLVGRTQETLTKVADEVGALGGEALVVRGSVSDPFDVDRIVDEAVAQFGSIHILVNNAGVFIYKGFLDLSLKDWDDTIDTNLKGIFLCCQAVLPGMVKQKQGNIINISSIHGKVGDAKLAAHCASKFGVIGLTQALARELIDYNINVNVICPGQVRSDWVDETDSLTAPLSTRLKPADVARVAIFLASTDSSIMTGSVIDVFGGTSVKIH